MFLSEIFPKGVIFFFEMQETKSSLTNKLNSSL